MKAATLLLAMLVTAATLVGCGNLDELPGRVEQPQLLTERDIERYPTESPARAVLEWWRALQFDNAALAARYYARRLEMTPQRLERKLRVGPELLGLKARFRVADVVGDGRAATVLAVLTRELRHPNGRTDKVRSAHSFDLVREGGKWRLSDNRYIDTVVRNVKIFFDKAGQAGRQETDAHPDQ